MDIIIFKNVVFTGPVGFLSSLRKTRMWYLNVAFSYLVFPLIFRLPKAVAGTAWKAWLEQLKEVKMTVKP